MHTAFVLQSQVDWKKEFLAFETVQPYETFRIAQHRSHIFLLREVIKEWKNLHPEAEQKVQKKRGLKEVEDKLLN